MFYPSQILVSKVKHLTGHSAGIFCLGEGGDANTVMSGSGDGIVAQWQLNGEDSAQGLARIPGSIFSLYLHKTLQLLITGSLEGTVFITDLEKKEEIHTFIPDGSTVYAIDLINENLIALACGSGKVYIYDLANKNIINTISVCALAQLFQKCSKAEINIELDVSIQGNSSRNNTFWPGAGRVSRAVISC